MQLETPAEDEGVQFRAEGTVGEGVGFSVEGLAFVFIVMC